MRREMSSSGNVGICDKCGRIDRLVLQVSPGRQRSRSAAIAMSAAAAAYGRLYMAASFS